MNNINIQLVMKIILIIFLFISQCNCEITPGNTKQYDAPFYYTTSSSNNDFLIDAQYVSSISNNKNIEYPKYGITYKPQTPPNIGTCLNSGSDLIDISKEGSNRMTMKFTFPNSLLTIYYYKIGICNLSTATIEVKIDNEMIECRKQLPSHIFIKMKRNPDNNRMLVTCNKNDLGEIYKEISLNNDFVLSTQSNAEVILNYVFTAQFEDLKPITLAGSDTCTRNGNEKCIQGNYCNGDKCTKCHELCNECYASFLNSCSKCKIISDVHNNNGECEVNYIKMSNFENIEINITPPKTQRVTLGVWTFVPYVNELSSFSIILEDFVTISIRERSPNNLEYECSGYSGNNLLVTDDNDSSGRWTYVECGLSVFHRKFFLRVADRNPRVDDPFEKEANLTNNALPIVDTDFDTYFTNYYRSEDTIKLKISSARIYLRNLWVFSEYMPKNIKYYHYDLTSISSKLHLKELIFSLPLNKLYLPYLSPYVIGINHSLNHKQIKIHLDKESGIFAPSRNLHRLVLLDANKIYETELSHKNLPTRNSNSLMDVNHNYFKCNNNEVISLNVLVAPDPTGKYVCLNGCPSGSSVLPLNNGENNFCIIQCDTTNKLTDCGDKKFPTKCEDGYSNFYYKCLPDSRKYYLFYSRMFKSGNINIQFTKNKLYRSYFIELWYYPYRIYNSLSTIDGYIFYSNAVRIYTEWTTPQNAASHMRYFAKVKDNNSINISNKVDTTQWNKFLINVVFEKDTYKVEFIINNNFLDGSIVEFSNIRTNLDLAYIVFVHDQPNYRDDSGDSTIKWGAGFYRNLRVWDGTKAQPSVTVNYDSLYDSSALVKGVILSLELSATSMENNKFQDTRKANLPSGISSDYVIEDVEAVSNVEIINYSASFDHSPLCNVASLPNCKHCWESKRCYKCEDGYKVVDSKCVSLSSDGSSGSGGSTTPDTGSSQLKVYKNPNKSNRSLQTKKLNAFRRGTICIWVKPYGLITNSGKLFSIGDKITFFYESEQSDIYFGLTIRYSISANSFTIVSHVDNFRDNLGKWTFISFAYWTGDSTLLSYFPPLMNFEINSESYDILLNPIPDNIVIDYFTLYEELYGLIGGVNFFNEYIIGGTAYDRFQRSTTPNGLTPYKQLFHPETNNCLNPNDFTDVTVTYDCMDDNDPVYKDNEEKPLQNEYYLFINNGRDYTSACSPLCNECFGEGEDRCACYLSDELKRNMIIHRGNKNYCQTLEYFNFGSCNDFTISLTQNKATPQNQFTMHVWVWVSDYIPLNFKGFEIIWEYHNAISISLDTNRYYFECYPKESDRSSMHKVPFETQKWNFLSCSINWDNKEYLLQTLTDKENAGVPLDPPLELSSTSYHLHIRDKNISIEWGYLLIRQIRLWNEYLTDSLAMSRVDIQHPELFETLIHLFSPTYDISHEITDAISNSNATLTCNVNLGVNAVKETLAEQLALCGDDGKYYQEQPEKCVTFLNINNLEAANTNVNANNEVFRINEIEPSYTGSYTMAFWIFIDNASKLTSIDFVFQDHLMIKLQKGVDGLDAYCYPQMHMKQYTYNVGEIPLIPHSGEWHWMMCAVSHYDEKFYLNGNYFQLKPDALYNGIVNDYPYRYFFTNASFKYFTINIQYGNTAKVYFRTMYLFNDFIPYKYNIQNTDLIKVDKKLFNELLFAINFDQIIKHSSQPWTGLAKLKYYTYYKNEDDKTESTLELYFNKDVSYSLATNFKYVPICDINEKVNAKGYCEAVNTCVLNQVHAKLGCTDEKTPIICENGYYMNVNSVTNENTCEVGCNENTLRLPGLSGVHLENAICSSACPDNSKGTCPNKSKVELSAMKNYYVCGNGYTRINYKCVPNEQESKSAFYYSKCYNLPNIELNIANSGCEVYDTNYIFEFWVMLDQVNFPQCSTNINMVANTQRYYVLYTNPHRIYYSNDNKFYYEYANSGDPREIVFHKYEWNRIAIIIDVVTTSITLYNNYKEVFTFTTSSTIPSPLSGVVSINFCSSFNVGTNCYNTITNSEWYSAYYKNFRIWDALTANINIVNAFGSGLFTKPTTDLVRFWPFTVTYIDNNEFKEGISSSTCNLKFTINPTVSYSSGIDEVILYNYSTMFDWGETRLGEYITLIDPDTKGVTSSACNVTCSRCTGSEGDKCYACKDKYVLYGTECHPISNYFLKLPLTSGNQLDLVSKKEDGSFDLATQKALTLSFFIKFFGNVNGAVSRNPEIISLSSTLKLLYDTTEGNNPFLSLAAGQTCFFKDFEFKNYIGKWTPIIIVDYISGSNSNVYPNILTLSVNNKDIQLVEEIPPDGLPITQLTFGSEIAALVGDLRVYSKAIQGAYGRIMAGISRDRIDLAHNIPMYGETKNGCMRETDLTVAGAMDFVECVGDYNVFLDPASKCTNNEEYFNEITRKCEPCNPECETNCYGADEWHCTCDLSEGKYWLREKPSGDTDTNKPFTYCEKIKYIDFSNLNKISFDRIASSATGESTLEFWVYIHQYVVNSNNFKEINLDWNKHNRVQILGTTVNCYPLVDITDYTKFSSPRVGTITFDAWNYVQCGTDLVQGETFVRTTHSTINRADINLSITRSLTDTFLIYSNVNSLNNYGFVFLRHIKLWQQYNKQQILTQRVNLTTYGKIKNTSGDGTSVKPEGGNFPGLRALFENDFDDYKMLFEDKVTDKIIDITRRSDYIGYNVVDFEDPVISCYEDQQLVGETCSAYSLPSCGIAGTDGCIACLQDNEYLHPVDLACVTDCRDGFYPNVDIKSCRPCYKTCYSCVGGGEFDCINCKEDYYFVEATHACVSECQDYGLVKKKDLPHNNKCVEFDVIVKLINPDENVAIDKKTFNKIVVTIERPGAASNPDTVNLLHVWSFDEIKTIEANDNNPELILNPLGPFANNVLNRVEVLVNPDFFQHGFKYTFCLTLYTPAPDSLTLKYYYTFYINAPPYGGELVITPHNGLCNTTAFIFDCINWKDDNYTMQVLEYRFYYIEDATTTEQPITDWTTNPETQAVINVNNFQQDQTKVIVYCEARDKYHDISKAEKELYIINDLSYGHYKLENALDTYEIPSEPTELHILVRSKLLHSMAIDPYKQLQPSFKQSYYEPSLDQSEIMLNDPECTVNYCNSFGKCLLIDTFISCGCTSGYLGTNCQVDINGYNILTSKYIELFDLIIAKLIEDAEYVLSGGHRPHVSDMLLNAIGYLFEGASLYYQDYSFFNTHLPQLFDVIVQYYEARTISEFFDFFIQLYEYYYEFLIRKVTNEKASMKHLMNSDERVIDLPEESINAYKEQFDMIFEQIDNLMNMYIKHSSLTTLRRTNMEFIYNSMYVLMTRIEPTTTETFLFSERKSTYKANINFKQCLSHNFPSNNYDLLMVYIEYSPFPLLYDTALYINNTSPLISIRFYDIATQTEIKLNCSHEHNASILINFPFNSFTWLEDINVQKHLYDPLNYKGADDIIFSDPILIEDNGFISNDTVEMRLKKYRRKYNITCRYWNNDTQVFDTDHMEYMNLTSDSNYIVCASPWGGRFTTYLIENNITYHTNSRFFYLYRQRIFNYYPNYIDNSVFWIWVLIVLVYLVFVIVFVNKDKKMFDNKGMIDFLKVEVVQNYFPYIDSSSEEMQQILKKINKKKNNNEDEHKRNFFVNESEGSDNGVGVGISSNNNNNEKPIALSSNVTLSKFYTGGKSQGGQLHPVDSSLLDKNGQIPNTERNRTVRNDFFNDDDVSNNENNQNMRTTKFQFETVHEEHIIISELNNKSGESNENNTNTNNNNDNNNNNNNEIHFQTHETNKANPPKKNKNDNNNYISDVSFSGRQNTSQLDKKYTNDESLYSSQRFLHKPKEKDPSYSAGQSYGYVEQHLQHAPVFVNHEDSLIESERQPVKQLSEKEILKEQERLSKEKQKQIKQQKEKEFQLSLKNASLKSKEDYALLGTSVCDFYCRNIRERHKFFSIFKRITIFHPRWKKITLIYMEIFILMLTNTILLTLDESLIIWPFSPGLLLVAIISISITVMLMYPLSLLFVIPYSNRDKLYILITKGEELTVLREWKRLSCKMNCQTFVGMMIFIILMIITFYFSFGFTAVWSVQRNTWICLTLFCVLMVYTLCEAMMELIVAMFYALRKKGKCCLCCGYCLNKARSKRVLWP